MQKLNTIFLFVLLSFCLLVNVSYCVTFEANEDVTVTTLSLHADNSKTVVYGDYNSNQIRNIVTNYYNDKTNDTYLSNYNDMISYLSIDYDITIMVSWYDLKPYFVFVVPKNTLDYGASVAQTTYEGVSHTYNMPLFGTLSGSYLIDFIALNQTYKLYYGTINYDKAVFTSYLSTSYFIDFSTADYKSLPYSSNKPVVWDGVSYVYKGSSEPDEPETPTMPTNAEIASAVQMFYNSVYNLPNSAFKDFIVLYDNTTGLYTYIGHTRGNALGQVIVEPNGYYEGYKFDVQWWKFFLDEQNDSWDWQNLDSYFNYYVYSSDGTIENLNYIGKSNINGLIEKSGPWATANTVIVYSTNDYPVKYVTFSEDSPDPDIQTGTIQGDQYTYDENLDITDNQYNPLDNFISVNYPSTLVGNADFDSFLNTFNENKDVLVLPQNANWVILANTSLFSYFGSFIIMCTLFIIIERIMRG